MHLLRGSYAGVLVGLLLVSAAEPSAGGSIDAVFADGFETPNGCDPDFGEPDSEAAAFDLGQTDDCDENIAQAAGVLGSSGDIDFFRVSASDELFCTFAPVLAVSATAPLRTCIYFECMEGTVSLSCADGTSPATSSLGRPGCCATGSSLQLMPDASCTGSVGDDMHAFVRLDAASETCVGYTVDLHF
jgi:hypothetical protein